MRSAKQLENSIHASFKKSMDHHTKALTFFQYTTDLLVQLNKVLTGSTSKESVAPKVKQRGRPKAK